MPVSGFPRVGTRVVAGTQLTVSEGNPIHLLQGESDSDVGSEFDTTRHFYEGSKVESSIFLPATPYKLRGQGPTVSYEYDGFLYSTWPSTATIGNVSAFPPRYDSSLSDLYAKGTTAIARCKPTSSPVNLSIALAELVREGIPSAIGHQTWKDRSNLARGAGSEHLNVQFGWLPLVSEIQDTARVYREWDSLVSQYERDSGRRVRRRYDFPSIRETSVIYEGPVSTAAGRDVFLADNSAVNAAFVEISPTKYRHTRETHVKTWFSGAFTYHLPSDYNSRNQIRRVSARAGEMLGLELTPEVLWNLTPWSWAVDWFANIGDVLSVVSDVASDGLVVVYGYLMEESIVRDTRTVEGIKFKGYPRQNLSSVFTTVRKRRVKATPFGFGLNWDGFSARQVGILAALGLSKTPRRLAP